MNRRLFFLVAALLLLVWVSVRMGEKMEQPSPVQQAERGSQGGEGGEGGEGGSGQTALVIRNIEILPASPNLKSTLRVSSASPLFNPSDYRYRWFVNKKEVGQRETLFLGGFRQGDIVSVELTPAGDTLNPPATASVKIGNNPPVIKEIRLLPLPVFAGSAVRAEVTTEDADNDFIHLMYEWEVNGEPIQNDRDTLEGNYVHSADTILVYVTPLDPFSKGARQVSPIVTVGNQSPEILSHPPQVAREGTYRYPVMARDPDNDSLHYRLLEGPPGMEIEPTTGVITWKIAPVSDNQPISIEVNDAKGGKVIQQFTVKMTAR